MESICRTEQTKLTCGRRSTCQAFKRKKSCRQIVENFWRLILVFIFYLFFSFIYLENKSLKQTKYIVWFQINLFRTSIHPFMNRHFNNNRLKNLDAFDERLRSEAGFK